MVLKVVKKEGETPLELIGRLREEGKINMDEKATYAGRLDPMASGAMIILTSDDVHRKGEFMALDKEYEVDVLFGFATDSYDILGKLEIRNSKSETNPEKAEIQKVLKTFVGKFVQEYPKFSSKYLSQNADPEESYSKQVEIYSVDSLGEREVSGATLLADIERRIAKVNGDFRQEEILKLWQTNIPRRRTSGEGKYSIIKIKVSCSSGTYMRSLAHELGRKLRVSALAYSIARTRIG